MTPCFSHRTETNRTPFGPDIADAPSPVTGKTVLVPLFLLILMGASFLSAAGQSPRPSTPAAEIMDTDLVVHDLCGKNVALLGESPLHSFGKTLKFKVAVVRRLVDECHYNAFFIESPAYDFIHIQRNLRSRQNVTDSMISAAIGGLWANQEVQSLIPFLTNKVNSGTLTLGGLDYQLGAGTWAQHEMPANLMQYLQGDERSRCVAVLQRNTLWQYTDAAPYGPADKAKIVGCLDEIEEHISQPGDGLALWPEGDRTMVDSLKRNFARNFTEDDFTKSDQNLKWMNDRDRSMYLNFQWLLSRLPQRSKVIVWAATVHTAKYLSALDGFTGRIPLGSYIRQDFGDRAFSLGFSAYTGSYAFTHQPIRKLTVAPESSLEGQSFVNRSSDTVYLSRKELRKLGPIPARPLGTPFTTTLWDGVLDGLVIFREERAPEYVQPR